MPRRRVAYTFDFELNLKARWLIALGLGSLILYLGLVWSTWQPLVSSEWLRLGAAWLIFLAPGLLLQQLLWRDISVSQRVSVGLGMAVALGATFGLVATAFHFALWFVMGALASVTIVCALALAARGHWRMRQRWHIQFSLAQIFLLIPLALSVLVVARLTYGLVLNTDDLTYTAYVTHWLEAREFDWQELPLGVPQFAASRFWLAYWTLNQALLAKWSGLHIFDLTRWYLAPFLGMFGLLATYALARAFAFSRAVSSFTVALQVAALVWLSETDQAGLVFFNRLIEDKVFAAFVLIPVFVITVTAFLKQQTRGRLALVALVGIALVLTHPTLMAVGVAAVGLYTVFTGIVTREWRGLTLLSLIFVLMLSAPLAIRVLDTSYTEKIPFDAETLQRVDQLRRVLQLENGLYAVHPSLYWGVPFLWTLAAALAGLLEWKTSYAARWIVAASVVAASVVNPLTAWTWGIAIGTSQQWRVLWLTPFAVAGVYLALVVGRSLLELGGRTLSAGQTRAVPALCGIVILSAALFFLLTNTDGVNLQALRAPQQARSESYARLLAFKPELDSRLREPTNIVGGDRWVNERLPGLSANARVFAFRSEVNMWQLSNLKWEDASARWEAWETILIDESTAAQRLAVLRKYRVRYIVAEPNTFWVHELAAFAPKHVQAIHTSGAMEMYQVKR